MANMCYINDAYSKSPEICCFYVAYHKKDYKGHLHCAYRIRAKYAIYIVPTPKEALYAIYMQLTIKE